MKAPRIDQLALLDLAALDSKIGQLRRENHHHPLRTELATVVNQIAATGREIAAAEEKVAQANMEVEQADAATEKLTTVIRDKESKLAAGVGMDSRQLLALQKEIDDARARLEQAEERDFAALEAAESCERELDGARAHLNALNTQMLETRSTLEAEIEILARDIEDLVATRERLIEPLDRDLVALYDRSRARGGFGVIGMSPNGTTTGGLQISPVEAASIRGGDPDDVHISDDYDAIIVLTN
ncbi:zinc ribbon domain-containing protein [Arcanobacterium canis]